MVFDWNVSSCPFLKAVVNAWVSSEFHTANPFQCFGWNTNGTSLAMAELHIALATVTRQFEIELFDTTVDDVRIVRDFFVGVPKLDSKGVRGVVVDVH